MRIVNVDVGLDEYEKDHGEDEDGRPIRFTISAEVFEAKLDFCIWPYLETMRCGWWGCWLQFRPMPNKARRVFEEQFGNLTQIAFSKVDTNGVNVEGAFRVMPDADDESSAPF